jgi:hypothetical protein
VKSKHAELAEGGTECDRGSKRQQTLIDDGDLTEWEREKKKKEA